LIFTNFSHLSTGRVEKPGREYIVNRWPEGPSGGLIVVWAFMGKASDGL
jgi:hypothetical protein